MLNHSNSAVTSIIIRNSNLFICSNISRSTLENDWNSIQAGDPQVAWNQDAATGLTNFSQSPGKVFSEVFPALTRDHVIKVKSVCNSFHLHISYDSVWGHAVMIPGSDQIVKSVFLHESQATNQYLASGSGSYYPVGPAAWLLFLFLTLSGDASEV